MAAPSKPAEIDVHSVFGDAHAVFVVGVSTEDMASEHVRFTFNTPIPAAFHFTVLCVC